ncbi:MAG TPA: UDP-N-acetylmuramoyl-tripeptide--D-alanyl-D-alanine ligase [Candidatus Binatia bacterium]|jgi:UDP-N-acetylmuramoyl-tripeptide--D-alanyl-D-alanine ligase|nr:UDP-N-acetylmuramoyl-tripeptide--D-alanyl-D-alanine ligase [Candidatus Binatia bacterium]
MAWHLSEILSATRGKLLREGRSERFGEVVTNSNKVQQGSVFVALKGERLDGHRFVGQAVRRGARCVVIHRELRPSAYGAATIIKVGDTLRALGDLAHHRRKTYGPAVLAITGSNGKTTTKEMIAAILEEAALNHKPLGGKILKTEGNFNNLVGLPLTLLGLRKTSKVAVVELGTNHPGEIKRLAEIAAPDMGLITSVAAAHLEGLSSLAGVAREKGALFSGIRPGGMIVVNLDDPWVRRLGQKFKGKKITYGAGGQVQVESWRSLGANGMVLYLRVGRRRSRVRLNFLGEHNVVNAAGAAAMAYGFGVSLAAIRRGLQKAKPFPMRMQLENWKKVGIINDAYNANPASMEAAIKTLAGVECRGEKTAILGDMFELGRQARRQHLKVGKQVARAGIDRLYLLGAHAKQVRQGALQSGLPAERIVIGRDHADLANRLRSHVQRGDWLLFKGSRGMKMEKVLNQLKSPAA